MFIVRKIVNIIFKDEKDKEIKNIIESVMNWAVVILLLLIILLLGTMFGWEFEKGIFDIDMMITVVPTVLGGYLGFLGSVVGVIGAYLILKKQLGNEIEKSKEKENLEIKMMKCLLEYTVSETDEIIELICKKYSKLYSNYLGKETLKLKFELSNKKVSRMINQLLYENEKEEDLSILEKKLGKKRYDELVRKINMSSIDYKNTTIEVCNAFNKIKNYKSLVYDKNWNSYLIAIKNSGNFMYEDIQNIINWIGILNNDLGMRNMNEINELIDKINETSCYGRIQEMKVDIKVDGMSGNIEKLLKEVLSHIAKFIDTRDSIISLVEDKKKFGEEVFSWEFDNSENQMIESIILTESIDNIVK